MEKINKIEEQITVLATELGIEIVTEIANQALIQKPNLKLKHFLQGLEEYKNQQSTPPKK